ENADTMYRRQRSEVNVERALQNLLCSMADMDNIVLYTNNITYFGSRKQVDYYRTHLRQEEWMQQIENGTKEQTIQYNYELSVNRGEMQKEMLLFAQRLYDVTTARYLGTLVITMPMEKITGIVDDMFVDGQTMGVLLDAEMQPVYQTNLPGNRSMQEILQQTQFIDYQLDKPIKKANYYAFASSLKPEILCVASIVTQRALTADAHKIQNELLLVSALLCLANIGVVLFTMSHMTKPLVQLCREMDHVSGGNLKIQMEDQPYAETSLLAEHFNNMVRKIEQLLHQVQAAEREKQEIELEVLEAQVNPHFVYNTLEAVKWVAIAQKSPNIPQIITALVKLLTMSISIKKKTVRLQDEIDYLKQYLTLMEFRFNNTYEVLYQIPAELQNVITIKMLLQPIVENSIFHGFSNKSGKIIITAEQVEGILVLKVEDNGSGFEKGRQEVNTRRTFTGIGIDNMDKRIKLMYGDCYGLTIQSKLGQGTLVTIRQPYIAVEQEANIDDTGHDC
ncbi:MAG: histidine kinase, partial [Ruthenibacterium sp.]